MHVGREQRRVVQASGSQSDPDGRPAGEDRRPALGTKTAFDILGGMECRVRPRDAHILNPHQEARVERSADRLLAQAAMTDPLVQRLAGSPVPHRSAEAAAAELRHQPRLRPRCPGSRPLQYRETAEACEVHNPSFSIAQLARLILIFESPFPRPLCPTSFLLGLRALTPRSIRGTPPPKATRSGRRASGAEYRRVRLPLQESSS